MWSALAENIHAHRDAASVVQSWMESPPHRANILGSNYEDVGVGCATDVRGVRYWALNLGRGW
jgi:uncharacterized protein YkwD